MSGCSQQIESVFRRLRISLSPSIGNKTGADMRPASQRIVVPASPCHNIFARGCSCIEQALASDLTHTLCDTVHTLIALRRTFARLSGKGL